MKFFRRLTLLLFLGMLTCLLVSACSRNVNQSAASSQQSSQECRVVQHGMGETCVPKTPGRLVALTLETLENAIALDVQPIGSITLENNKFPAYLEGKTAGIKSVGSTQASIERILLLQPDIIMSWKHHHESIYSQLSGIAPTVLYDWRGNLHLPHRWKEYFNFMAEVLGREDAAQKVWEHYNQRIEQLKTALGDRYQDKTISVIMFCCGGIHNGDANSFSGSILSDVGLQRPESQQVFGVGIPLSEEKLALADGDVMFVMAYGGNDTGKRDLSILQKKPLWKTLKAVQQNRVYYVDPEVWRGRNPFAADAVIDDLYKYLVNAP